tara:strand:+ start:401 stop:844 length:444 start_codon:yes stop_codon:yes gene_type:complete
MKEILVKSYKELTKKELYNILKLRSEVFVVEQNCVYQDIDSKDQKAYHVFFKIDEKIKGYTRIFKSGDYFEYSSIGRVVVSKKERKRNNGSELILASIRAIEEKFNERKIKISAQKHLEKFYNTFGFISVGKDYLEDGIPHIAMVKN